MLTTWGRLPPEGTIRMADVVMDAGFIIMMVTVALIGIIALNNL